VRNKYLFVIIILTITGGRTFCQLVPFQDEDAMVTPGFNTDFIHSRKISGITISYFTKPDGARINDDGITKKYFFDTTGKITGEIDITKTNDGRYDTIKCKYYYDSLKNITVRRTEMDNFFDTWYYKWNKDNRVEIEVHVHETSRATDGEFKIATQKVISTDSFAYIVYPKQLQQYKYNEDNKIFQTTITQYDDNKRFLSRNCHYAVGWLYSQVDIKYDASGRIIGYQNTGNLNGVINHNTTIKYDSLGKIVEEGIWVDYKQRHHIEYMYEDGLISNKLDRDNEKGVIGIIRFSYEMYDTKGNVGAER